MSDHIELELQVVVSCQTWELGTERCKSSKNISSPKCVCV